MAISKIEIPVHFEGCFLVVLVELTTLNSEDY